MEGPLIQVHELFKSYRRDSLEIPVLRNINLDIAEGEFLAFMGPSGSGKTTLLNLIAGIDRATSGAVRVAGTDLTPLSEGELAKWRSRNVGFIFQFYNLIPVLSALENVELPLLLTSLDRHERLQRARTALDVVGLGARARHVPAELSGGEQQRVAIARAIVTDPDLIIADEPTGDLDAKNADEILRMLLELSHELQKTVVMVTHDPRAASLADRVLFIGDGLVISELPGGDPARLADQLGALAVGSAEVAGRAA